jgi:cytochrome d ubiquinol oxidase subunit I
VSTSVSAGTILTSMIVFTVLYAALGVVWFRLIARYAREGAPETAPPATTDESETGPLSFAY